MRQPKNNKQRGQWAEEEVRKCLNSGGLWFNKGDLDSKDYKIEVKFTDKSGFRITPKILEKIWNDSLTANKLPAIVIVIRDKNNPEIGWKLETRIGKIKIPFSKGDSDVHKET
jgi:hypothetical protein